MNLTIKIPGNIQIQLQQQAAVSHISMEELVVEILNDSLIINNWTLTPEEVVTKIKAMPQNINNIRPAKGSLAEALHKSPDIEGFDLAVWQTEWKEAEKEMKAITRENDIAEGRLDD